MKSFISIFLFLVSSQSFAELSYLGCPEHAEELDLTIQGELKLNKNFITDIGEDIYKAAAIQQLRYARGYFLNHKKELKYSLLLTAEKAEVEIVKVEPSKYNLEYQIDSVTHPDVKIDEPYMLEAIRLGKTNTQDDALKISYKAKLKGYFCGPEKLISKIEVAMPTDPYLIYYSVADKDRLFFKWRDSKFRINPCADSEYVDIPHPYFFWYFWDPYKKGKDYHKKPFDCRSLMSPGNDFYTVKPEVLPNKNKMTELGLHSFLNKSKNKNLKISVVFGVIDTKAKLFDKKSFLSKNKSYQKTLSEINKLNLDQIELGAAAYLRFLKDISSIATIRSFKLNKSKNLVEINAVLNDSKRKATIEVFFGHTDLLSSFETEQWQFLKKSFQKSDFIMYYGHAGLGLNLKISNVLELTKTTAENLFKTSPNYQMTAYFSCYSYGYFGEDYIALRKATNPEFKTDILLSAVAFDGKEKGPLGLIYYIDQMAKNNNLNIDSTKWLSPNDQIILITNN